MEKKLFLATFIYPKRVDLFISYLELKYKISKDKIYQYSIIEDPTTFVFTFKITISDSKNYNLKDISSTAVPIHKKLNTFYTINALNKLIEEISPNIKDNKNVIINWENYENKLILLKKNKLVFLTLQRVF